MPAKIFLAAGLAVLLCGVVGLRRVSAASEAAFVPQNQSEQDRFQKEMQERMFKQANKKRQEDIKNDTEKLFQLATELKAAVDKTNENMLSLEVIRKAEQVEKLAKKVKENMKEVIGPPQNLPTPVPAPTPFSH
ncbi:MAG TPA: hypothetical protein VFR84_16210 [Candidatus Angelobacter sp.]|nr:hypothetical protein [Candidatus Angelobacter sp.]